MVRVKNIVPLVAILLLSAIVSAQSASEVAEKVMPSVVVITTDAGDLSFEEQLDRGPTNKFGSGFFVADGIVATNYHVIRDAGRAFVKQIGETNQFKVRGVVGHDEAADLVLLAVEGLNAPSLPIAGNADVKVGDTVFVVGNPQGLEGTFSQGMVSAIRGGVLIQITAPVSSGSSGGPVLNERGEVVGVAVATLEGGQNLNFAIPASHLQQLVSKYKESVEVPNGSEFVQPLDSFRKSANTEPNPAEPELNADQKSFLMSWLRKSVEEGDVDAMRLFAQFHYKGILVYEDDVKAAHWMHKAADRGIPEAMFCLGLMYADGRGVPQDESEKFKWYKQAAEIGVVEAMFNLGVSYADGRGVQKDDIEAVKWYQRAAELGDPEAMNNLGSAYAEGAGVSKDDTEASKWHRKAAERGNAVAMFNLGTMYLNGRGVEKSDSEAIVWFRKAAEHGIAEAIYNLGVYYSRGKAVPEDDEEAYIWFSLAAAFDCDKAADARDLQANYLTTEARLAAQKRSQELFEQISLQIAVDQINDRVIQVSESNEKEK